ncbi:MAG: 50S ribosomal protein L22 [Planctomycetota bacterium]|jgi:large subunit ribosomal protein L22|nr:50S ribosomal protein L22 [Planctomycetota bacterium]
MSYLAKHRGAPLSPRKARLIIDLIRGKDLGMALSVLQFAPQRAAKLLYKVVRSAQANAENLGVEDVDKLYVSKAWVDESFRIKRFRPRSRGMANPYVRRRSHLCVELDVRGE